jgi:hypothetical protein
MATKHPSNCRACGHADCPNVSTDAYWRACPAEASAANLFDRPSTVDLDDEEDEG